MSPLRMTVLAAATMLFASSGGALAQKARYHRDQDVTIDVHPSDKVKAMVPKVKAREPITASVALAIEDDVSTVRTEQEAILARLIVDTPDADADEKANYYFMLGELYAKQQRLFRLKAAEGAIAADKIKNPQQKTKAQADASHAAETAKQYLLKAVRTYKDLTDNDAFRNFPKMDMALFFYGYTLQGGKYLKEARAVYDKLLKNYPSSKYVPEAHLAFADYYFESGQLDDAEARYKMVLKFPKSSAYWYAMYKTGWIHLNKQRFQEALETFFQVAQATKNDPKQEVLNRASKKDFVRAYAEIGKADQAFNAFKRVDAGYAFEMEAILADLYLEQGKSDKAIFTYRDLMKRAPTNKNVCLWQYNVAHASLSMVGASTADKVAEILNLAKLYGALDGKKVMPVAEAQECRDNAAAMSGELARAYHSEAARTKNWTTLGYADKLYKANLDVFPDAADYPQTQYFHAELLWTRADNEPNARLATELWENAAIAFTEVVKTARVDPKLMKEAAYAAVLGWKNALDIEPRPEPKEIENSKAGPPQPIPEREQKMLAAFDLYIHYIKDPNDDELVGMKFLEGNALRRYNHFDEAIPIFLDILEHHRQHETAEYAANLLLDIYNLLGRHQEMLALADKLDQDKPFLEGKQELAATIGRLKAKAMRDRAQAYEKQGKYIECGLAYQDIYNRNPEATSNDEVLYNAGVCFEEGKSVGAAIGMYAALQKYYPSSKITAHAVARLGKAYGDIAFYDRASEKLEEYATKYAGEADARQALNDAVIYRKGLGDDKKAIEDTKKFVATFGAKNARDAANASFSLTSIYEKANDKAAVIKHLGEYAHVFGDQGGVDKLVIAHAKIGLLLWEQSCPITQIDGSCVKIDRERAISSKRQQHRKGGEQPLQCGPESKIKLTVVKRDDRKVHDALVEFAKAEKEFEVKAGKTGGDEGGARYYYGLARFAEADLELEKYLDLKFPANLDFDNAPEHKAIRDRSLKRFDAWLEAKTKSSVAVATRYAKLLELKDAASSIAAAARLGQITQAFSDGLYTAPIPKDVRTGEFADEKVEAYCDALTEKAEPLAVRSVELFSACLGKSTELGWFSSWSKLCERELGQIKPEVFPTASELRADSNQLAPVIAVESVARLD